MRLLDALSHVTADGRWFETGKDASLERLLRELDSARVERAVVTALAGYVDNQVVFTAARRHPDRLIPAGSVNPAAADTPEAAVTLARQELRDADVRIVKLHPRIGGYDPLDPRLLAVLQDMAAWPRPPLVWLCSLFRRAAAPLRQPPVEAAHHLVASFPTLTFVLLHGGGTEVLALAEAVRGNDNAFLDLSLTIHRYAGTSVALDLGYLIRNFWRRTLFGSDFPELGLPEARRGFEELCARSGASAEAAAHVGALNLERLLARVGL